MSILSYGPDPLQTIKVFCAPPNATKTLVLIHGGGWRDPSNTFDDFSPLIPAFSDVPYNVVSLNYRLSPRVNTQEELDALPSYRHPLHLIDILRALTCLQKNGFEVVSLAGHSVGAGLCLQLMNYDEVVELGRKYVTVNEDIDWDDIHMHLAQIKLESVFFIDGIVDVKALIQEYGDSYRTFVRCAFDSDTHFTDAFQTSSTAFSPPNKLITDTTVCHIVHSTEDELLSLNQSQVLRKYFTAHKITPQVCYEPWGQHEEVYTRPEVAAYIKRHLL